MNWISIKFAYLQTNITADKQLNDTIQQSDGWIRYFNHFNSWVSEECVRNKRSTCIGFYIIHKEISHLVSLEKKSYSPFLLIVGVWSRENVSTRRSKSLMSTEIRLEKVNYQREYHFLNRNKLILCFIYECNRHSKQQ